MVALEQNPVGQFLLKSIFRALVGKDNQQWYDSIDWELESDRFRQRGFTYPDYYSSQNFHGIAGGYLNAIAAMTYDPVAALASPPNEAWVRQQWRAAIAGQPQQILDLGCGTGAATLMLKQRFPAAQVIGLELSPYMLVVAERKAGRAGLSIEWRQGLAEATGFVSDRFDLVTASFLLHETPPSIAQQILQEGFRLLRRGGQILILDGNQKVLRHTDWLIDWFREPYSKAYAAGDLQDWMQRAGFGAVHTHSIGWIHQVTKGFKLA